MRHLTKVRVQRFTRAGFASLDALFIAPRQRRQVVDPSAEPRCRPDPERGKRAAQVQTKAPLKFDRNQRFPRGGNPTIISTSTRVIAAKTAQMIRTPRISWMVLRVQTSGSRMNQPTAPPQSHPARPRARSKPLYEAISG